MRLERQQRLDIEGSVCSALALGPHSEDDPLRGFK